MGQLGRHGWSAWRPLLLQRRLMSASSEGGGLVTCEMIETGSGLVGKVSFNSPGRLNALTVPMAEDFTHTLTKKLMESEVKNIRAVSDRFWTSLFSWRGHRLVDRPSQAITESGRKHQDDDQLLQEFSGTIAAASLPSYCRYKRTCDRRRSVLGRRGM